MISPLVQTWRRGQSIRMRKVFHWPWFFTFTLSGGTMGKMLPMDSGAGLASTSWKMLSFMPHHMLRPCSGAWK